MILLFNEFINYTPIFTDLCLTTKVMIIIEVLSSNQNICLTERKIDCMRANFHKDSFLQGGVVSFESV